MSKYTIELRELVGRGYGLALSDYPIFDERHRASLNQKIIDHYYFREIGFETADRFNFALRRKMAEIMPYYNQLYQSECIKFNPIVTEYMKNSGYTDLDKYLSSDHAHHSRSDVDLMRILSNNIDTKGTNDRTLSNGTHETGNFNTDKSGNKTIDFDHNETQNDLRTDNLTETTAEKTHSDQLTTTDMTKAYDSKKDTTGTRTDNLHQNTTEDITTHQTVTNDLHTKQATETDGNGTSSATGWEDEIYSDLPQSNFHLSRTEDPEGDGGAWPTTYAIDGYATTDTVKTNGNSGRTTSHETGNSNTDNTGTVTTEGTSNTTGTKDNTGTVDNVGNETVKDTTADTGTVDVDTDTTLDRTVDNTGTQTNDKVNHAVELTKEGFTENENGTHEETANFDEAEGIVTTGNQKTDEQISEKTGTTSGTHSQDISKEDNTTKYEHVTSGRSKWSPALLLQQFRATFLNIDMQIIEELDTLFMGVY